MSQYHVGITIGPIIETLCLASRPASLWCASSMFSWLAEDICNRAIAKKFEVISPFYPIAKGEDKYSAVAEGVGKYYDRIIFSANAESCNALKTDIESIIAAAKKALADKLVTKELVDAVNNSKDDDSKTIKQPEEAVTMELLKKVITDYLQVRYVIEEKTAETVGNCILRLSPYLDAAELSPSFKVDQSIQPIMTLFEGRDEDKHNKLVKLCFGGMTNINTSQIIKDDKVRDIGSIAKSVKGSDKKIFNYYAVVQADGDSMGALLHKLGSDEQVEKFSETCLQYTTIAADLVKDFGGMTIYAGGDDLLFISPLMNKEGKTVFGLCSDISAAFNKVFDKEEYKGSVPTVSFGISINYKKFPLYEALADALAMLKTAKKVENKEEAKNKTAVHIRKGSGQSAKLRYFNGGVIQLKLDTLISSQADETVLKSMLHKIGLYRPVLITALKCSMDLEQTFNNLFDSEYHGTVMEYIQKVRKALEDIYKSVKENETKDFALEEIFGISAKSNEEIALDLLYSMLRIAKFFSEKRGGKNG